MGTQIWSSQEKWDMLTMKVIVGYLPQVTGEKFAQVCKCVQPQPQLRGGGPSFLSPIGRFYWRNTIFKGFFICLKADFEPLRVLYSKIPPEPSEIFLSINGIIEAILNRKLETVPIRFW